MPIKQVKVDNMIKNHSLTYPSQQCTSQQFAKCTVQQGFRLLKPPSSELLVTAIREDLQCRNKSTVQQELRRLKPPSSELHSHLRTKIPQYHNNKYKLQQFHFLVTAMHDLN